MFCWQWVVYRVILSVASLKKKKICGCSKDSVHLENPIKGHPFLELTTISIWLWVKKKSPRDQRFWMVLVPRDQRFWMVLVPRDQRFWMVLVYFRLFSLLPIACFRYPVFLTHTHRFGALTTKRSRLWTPAWGLVQWNGSWRARSCSWSWWGAENNKMVSADMSVHSCWGLLETSMQWYVSFFFVFEHAYVEKGNPLSPFGICLDGFSNIGRYMVIM